MTSNVIILRGTDEFLTERVKALPENIIAGTHYNEVDMKRRLAVYREDNFNPKGLPALYKFFEENGVEKLDVEADADEYQVFE